MKQKNKIKKSLLVSFFLLAISAPQVFSQDEKANVEVIKNKPDFLSEARDPNVADCFDYYKFNSVQVSLGAAKNEFVLGETVVFSGELINGNDYPVVDGNVFVRISEKNPDYIHEGQFIVDEFIALSDISLDAKERKPATFQWKIPQSAKNGQYRVDFFFTVGKKYNLGGLPFTNEIIVGFANFSVKSSSVGSIAFDKSKTTVNGKKYNHVGNWPVIEPNGKVEISQPIKNSTKETKKITVKYDLYFWDGLREEDKIDFKTEEIVLVPGGVKNLEYSIPAMKDSVYYLKITAVSGDAKSIVNVRLASSQNHPRLNFPAITKFPVQKGENLTLFSCFHNTSAESPKGKVMLSLFGRDGKKVDDLNYDGNITGAMMVAKKDIVAKENYDYLKLEARLLDESGKEIEKYESVYDCQKINPEKCVKESGAYSLGGDRSAGGMLGEGWKTYALIVLLIIPIGLIGYLIFKKMKK